MNLRDVLLGRGDSLMLLGYSVPGPGSAGAGLQPVQMQVPFVQVHLSQIMFAATELNAASPTPKLNIASMSFFLMLFIDSLLVASVLKMGHSLRASSLARSEHGP